MKKLLSVIAILGLTFAINFENIHAQGLQAQTTKSGSVTGHILDAISGLPVSFAEVTIYDAYTRNKVQTIIADESGHFILDEISIGTYQIQVRSKGSETYRSLPFMISDMGKTKDFDLIKIGAAQLQNTGAATADQ